MTNQELKQLLMNKIKECGKTPFTLTIDNEEYTWSGGQKVGQYQLYRYRKVGIYEFPVEKQILLPC